MLKCGNEFSETILIDIVSNFMRYKECSVELEWNRIMGIEISYHK
jgi:hypothetical protein